MKAAEIRCVFCGRLNPRPGDVCPSGQECKGTAVHRYNWQPPQPAKITTRQSRAAQIMLRQWQDALSEATPEYWDRRASQFDAVHPDFTPLPLDASPASVDLTPAAVQTALACRRHAAILRDNPPEDITGEVRDALEQVA